MENYVITRYQFYRVYAVIDVKEVGKLVSGQARTHCIVNLKKAVLATESLFSKP